MKERSTAEKTATMSLLFVVASFFVLMFVIAFINPVRPDHEGLNNPTIEKQYNGGRAE